MPHVLHLDLDEFIAAVEVLRRPELAGLPVVVGGRGDPTERGVVATASYAARERGVGSGTPLRVAARRCPDAVFLAVDKPAYEAASAQVLAVVRALEWGGAPLLVEVLGWDEAFLGPGPGAREEDPAAVADRVRTAVLDGTGLHSSVGIGENRLQAKTATGFGKPRGVFALTHATWPVLMGPRPTTAIGGIGSRTARRLGDLGLATVADLAAADPAVVAEHLGGRTGPWLVQRARGLDSAVVDPVERVAVGHGREETFQEDLTDPGAVGDAVRALARRVAADVAAEGRPAVRVGLKVRLRPFTTRTRSLTLPAPTLDPDALGEAAVSLLDRLDEADRARAVRLLGVRLEMAPPAG